MKNVLFFFLLLMGDRAWSSPHFKGYDSIPAKSTDVGSVDGIVSALYQCVSGPIGEKRNWDRMRTLFAPDARLTATGLKEGKVYKRSMLLEEYIEFAGPRLEKSGFFEIEIARKLDQYASVAHLFSTYESRYKTTDVKPFARGINSIQLFNDGKRWWIVNILWASESPAAVIPEKYLK